MFHCLQLKSLHRMRWGSPFETKLKTMHLLRRNRHGRRNHEVRQIVLQFFNHHHKRQYDRQIDGSPFFSHQFKEKKPRKFALSNCTEIFKHYPVFSNHKHLQEKCQLLIAQPLSKDRSKMKKRQGLAEIKTKEESCTVAGKPKEKRKKCSCWNQTRKARTTQSP